MDIGLQTIKISELPEAITLNESDYSFIVQNGTSKKIKGLLLKGNAGDNGKSIEIQKTDTHIQWRQEGGQWINLVALADLKGDKGEQGGGSNVDLTDYATKVWVTQQLASYYTKTEINSSLSNKANISHTHISSDITDLSIPTNVSELNNDVDFATKTYVNNKIAEASLSGGEVDLSGYAPIDNPSFTGYISMNRKADTTVGHRSNALGDNNEASGQYSFAEGKDGVCRINSDGTDQDLKMNTYCIDIYLYKDDDLVANSHSIYVKMPEARAENLLLFFKVLNDNNRDVKIEMDRV